LLNPVSRGRERKEGERETWPLDRLGSDRVPEEGGLRKILQPEVMFHGNGNVFLGGKKEWQKGKSVVRRCGGKSTLFERRGRSRRRKVKKSDASRVRTGKRGTRLFPWLNGGEKGGREGEGKGEKKSPGARSVERSPVRRERKKREKRGGKKKRLQAAPASQRGRACPIDGKKRKRRDRIRKKGAPL